MGNETETVTEQVTEMVTDTEHKDATPAMGKSVEAQIADMQAALKKANTEAAKYRKQVEAIEQAEQARKDAELSEMDKLKKQLTEFEAKARRLELTELQRQAAEKAKLPPVLATRLQGETLEELEKDAEALAKTLPKTQPPGQPTNPGGNANGETETYEQKRQRLLG